MSDKTLIRRIPKTPVPQEVSRQLLELILAGTLAPGQKLPSEKQLIAALGVSRPALREALHGLAVLGFLESRQGSGHFVRHGPFPARLEEQLRPLLAKEAETLALQEARRVVEPVVVALAAQRATAEDVRTMESALQAYDLALNRGEAVFQLGVQVHEAFAGGCGNPALAHLVRTLIGLTAPLQHHIYRRAGLDRGAQDVQDHWAIYRAIARRAPREALDRMVQHLGHVEATVQQAILAAAEAALTSPARGRSAAAAGGLAPGPAATSPREESGANGVNVERA